MKSLSVILPSLFFLVPFFINAQSDNQSTLAKFIITDATNNGQDVTPILLQAGAYTVFYTNEDDGLIYMANVWPNTNSQSYGPMYAVEVEKQEETNQYYETDVFYFNWKYYNTYDDKTGTAKVVVMKIYKPQGIIFTVKIIPEDLDLIIYKGYMEGTVNFRNFNKSPRSISSKPDRFRRDYNVVSIFNVDTKKWSEWLEGDNTFVINYNEKGDIAHYKENGEIELYKKISDVEEGYTSSGEHYQIITALDGDGGRFKFQFFDDPNIGLKMIYQDLMIQYAIY